MRPVLTGFFVAAMGLGACSGAHEPAREHVVGAAAPGRSDPGLNVPDLLALSLDELSQRMGPPARVPAGFVDPTLAPLARRNDRLDSVALFRKRGVALVAAYDYQSRRVSDLLLLGTNEEELMKRAHLQLGAERYLVLPVFQPRKPNELMGLRVLSINVN